MQIRDVFIGRQQPLRDLFDRWSEAAAGRGGLAVVEGEGGIGKTVLVDRLVATADPTPRVAWGACPGSGAPPLWPWRRIAQSLTAPVPGPPAASSSPPAPGPTSVSRSGTDAGPLGYSELLDTVASAVAVGGPTIVVLDDLHRADPDSVEVLRLLVAEVRHLPLLVVATLRPEEGDAQPAVRGLLADEAASTTTVRLGGLPAPDVEALAAALTSEEATTALTTALVRGTGGNPFFVREVLRLLVSEGTLDEIRHGGDVPLPPAVREVLTRRISYLSAPTRALLHTAALAGSSPRVATVGRVAGLGPDEVATSVDELAAVRLADASDGRIRFAHDLVREAAADGLAPAERRRLHLELGAVADDPIEAAENLLDARPLGDPTVAARAALAAGRASLAAHAPVAAARVLARGVAAVDGDPPADLSVPLLLALGEAESAAGDSDAARRAFARAAAEARASRRADDLADAALGFAGLMGTPRPDPEQITLLEEVHAARGDGADPRSARIKARLAHALLFHPDTTRRVTLADEALALARASGDTTALAHCLYAWCLANVTSSNFHDRLERADEFLTLARASGDEEIEAWALHLHAHHMAEAGDLPGFDADVATCDARARHVRQATWSWTVLLHRAMRATMQGRFDDGEALGGDALALGLRSQHELAGATYGAHLMALRTWQGRLDEVVPMIVAVVGDMPDVPAVWASVPYAYAEVGRTAEAAAALERIADERVLEDVPGAHSWTVAVAMLVRTAALVGDAASAARLRPLLDPFADRHVVGPFAESYFGPASLYLGLAAATVGDLPAATGQLEQAMVAADAVGARPVAAWARAELAEVLARGGGAAPRVEALKAVAREEMVALGMPRHLARLDAATPAGNAWTRTGDGWEVTYAGRTVTLRASKGMTDLHRLVAAGGDELHVLELAREAEGPSPRPGPAMPVLDEEAKAAYRRHLTVLEEEVREARDHGDLARAERAEAERDAVVTQLAEALGFGGRDRTIVDETERARQAVRARIRYALDRVAEVHPELHDHLVEAVVTGTFCSYRPRRPQAWTTSAAP